MWGIQFGKNCLFLAMNLDEVLDSTCREREAGSDASGAWGQPAQMLSSCGMLLPLPNVARSTVFRLGRTCCVRVFAAALTAAPPTSR